MLTYGCPSCPLTGSCNIYIFLSYFMWFYPLFWLINQINCDNLDSGQRSKFSDVKTTFPRANANVFKGVHPKQ